MSHWRKRIGDKLDILLAETLRLAHDAGALKKGDLARVTVDTTVQPKNVAFPTDAKLLETAVRQLAKLAGEHDVPLRQSYVRVAKKAAMMAGRLRPRQAVQADERADQVPAHPLREADPRHRTQDRRPDRNFLHGRQGDCINAVMSAVGDNLRLILKWLRKLLRLIIAAIWGVLMPRSVLKWAS